MLDITSSMAVAVRRLMESDFRPKGTLVYSAVADEEAMGTFGAQWLVENAWNDVRCEYLVTEFGGARLPLRGTIKLPIMTSEKGSHWVRLRMRGTPGHGSLPYQSDNALVKAAELATRIARYKAPLRLSDLWKRFIERLELAAPARLGLTNPATFDIALKGAPEGAAGLFYSATRTTFSPNVVQAGVKTNVIPDSAELYVDVRTVAGDEGPEVRKMLREAAGEQLWRDVEIVDEGENPATQSPIGSPLWDALTRVTQRLVPGSETVPFIFVAATDARFFRRKGVTAYGYGLRSLRISGREVVGLRSPRSREPLRLPRDRSAVASPCPGSRWPGEPPPSRGGDRASASGHRGMGRRSERERRSGAKARSQSAGASLPRADAIGSAAPSALRARDREARARSAP